MLLGTVGAFNWSGGALLYDTQSRRGSFLNQTAEYPGAAQYSYLGKGRVCWMQRGRGWGLEKERALEDSRKAGEDEACRLGVGRGRGLDGEGGAQSAVKPNKWW